MSQARSSTMTPPRPSSFQSFRIVRFAREKRDKVGRCDAMHETGASPRPTLAMTATALSGIVWQASAFAQVVFVKALLGVNPFASGGREQDRVCDINHMSRASMLAKSGTIDSSARRPVPALLYFRAAPHSLNWSGRRMPNERKTAPAHPLSSHNT